MPVFRIMQEKPGIVNKCFSLRFERVEDGVAVTRASRVRCHTCNETELFPFSLGKWICSC